jgi:hypothetical protein
MGKDKKWNKRKWQGRSKKQVEDNNKVLGYTLLVGFITLVAYFLYKLLDL